MATKHNIQVAIEAARERRFDEAAKILDGVLRAQPGNEKARWIMIQCLEQTGAFDQVQAHLRELLRQVSRDLAKITQTAMFVRQRGYPLDDVIGVLGKFVQRTPGSSVGAYNYAYYLDKDGQHDKSIEQYQRALDLGIKSPEEVHLNLANIFMDHVRDDERARKHLEAALRENPNYAQAHFNLGNLAERMGDRDEATRQFEKCLELNPENDYALARLADAHEFEDAGDPLLDRLIQRSGESKNADLHFALGRAQDRIGNYEEAWRYFVRANELDGEAHPEYRQSHSEALVRRIISRCTPEWFSSCDGASHDPAFICGIFRSGSTLLEQILAAHPRFTAAGESEFFPRLISRHFRNYPDGIEQLDQEAIETWREAHQAWSDRLTGGNTRVTDKRPDNFLYVGLIKAILPGAKFVVTERDWRDIAVSLFSTRLGPAQGYARSLRDIRHYLGLHRELVDHWAGLLGDDLVRVSYEELVNQPRETIGNLLERLGEPWDDACLDFDKQQATVSTASVWQVRQPLNPKSIGRWKHYEKYFTQAFGEDVKRQ